MIYVVKLIKAYKLRLKSRLKKMIFSLTKQEKRNYHSLISCRVTRYFSLVKTSKINITATIATIIKM